MFALMGLGAIISIKSSFHPKQGTIIAEILITIAMPGLILYSFISSENTIPLFNLFLLMSLMITICLVGICLLFLIGKSVFSAETKKIALLSTLGNTGFIGIPLCFVVFGPEGAVYAAVVDISLDIVLWTVAPLLLAQTTDWQGAFRAALVSPPFAAIVIGLMWMLFNFEAPVLIVDIVEYVALLATPLAMMFIGMHIPPMFRLGKLPLSFFEIGSIVTIKLLLLPMIVYSGLYFLVTDPLLRNVLVLQTAMPTVAAASIIFEQHQKAGMFATQAIVCTTLISVVTLPLIVWVLFL
ncbi:AEC family transporter [Salsuginibacillus kocurii]|uniref:AEC family transporter n=1 Tax=Salsuginibacillus kocurii TaxID=427078 RepID=UPI0012EA0484|nr:AEC family transporter [Salsuginibacillus kocurii]